MDKLKSAAQFYNDNFLNRKFRLKAGKNKQEIEFDIVFAASNFKHLIGLNKLTDLPIISESSSAVNFRQILNNELTYDYITQSKYFSEVEQRIEHFADLYKALNGKDLLLKSQHGNFNTIIADFMLTNKNDNYGYAHLFMRNDDRKGYTVPITYIINPDNAYLRTHAERWTVLSVEEVQKTEKKAQGTVGQSSGYNAVKLIGALVSNPRVQQTATGEIDTDMTQYDISVTTNGRSDIFSIASFGKQAQTDAKYLRIGNTVMVVGEIQTGQRSESGIKIPTFRINASSVKYLKPTPTAKTSLGNGDISKSTKNDEEQF